MKRFHIENKCTVLNIIRLFINNFQYLEKLLFTISISIIWVVVEVINSCSVPFQNKYFTFKKIKAKEDEY